VSCAHSPHPRTGTPHGWVPRIKRCVKMGTKGHAVLMVKRKMYASWRALMTGLAAMLGYNLRYYGHIVLEALSFERYF